MKRLLPLLVVVCLPAAASAQKYYKYLGNGESVSDKYSPDMNIRFNDRGFENVTTARLNASQEHLIGLGAPESQIKKLMKFPDQDYGKWVESAYQSALSQFTACGGDIAAMASRFDPASVYVWFEAAPFTDPNLPLPNGEVLAGEYIPGQQMIRAVAFYRSESDGELAYLPNLLKWEWGNAIADFVHVTAEPRGPNWPCH
ncbi:MAG TPA: hypothetical protein VLZ81_05600 [Blastocatellia bacterium]|nr:hypothetical protein [Blastocatellia bacterium]